MEFWKWAALRMQAKRHCFAAAALILAPWTSSKAQAARPEREGFVVEVQQPANLLRQHSAALLLELGYAIVDATPSRLVTSPRFSWPKGSESLSWHGALSPGVVLTVEMGPMSRDSTTRLTVSAYGPVREAGSAGEIPHLLRVYSALQFLRFVGDGKPMRSVY